MSASLRQPSAFEERLSDASGFADTRVPSSTSAQYANIKDLPLVRSSAEFRRLEQSHRGVPLSHTYLSSGAASASPDTSTALKPRITLLYSLPLSSIITTFHSTLKSITSGFASFDYEEAPYESSDLCRMNILVNGQKVDALCTVVHRSQVQQEGRDWAKRLRDVIPRQQYEVSWPRVLATSSLVQSVALTCLVPFLRTGHYSSCGWIYDHLPRTVSLR